MDNPHPLLAGLKGRCPNCGSGRLFSGFLKVAPACDHCGYDLAKADSGDGPAVFVILIAGFIPMFLTAYAYRELNSRAPDCGASFTWSTKAFGPYVGWISGFMVLLSVVGGWLRVDCGVAGSVGGDACPVGCY